MGGTAGKHLFAPGWLGRLFHIHWWEFDHEVGSKGNRHLRCRCHATKVVPL